MADRDPDPQIFGLSKRAALEYAAILALLLAIIYRAIIIIIWDKYGPPG